MRGNQLAGTSAVDVADAAKQLATDPLGFLYNQVTDTKGRANAAIREIARDEAIKVFVWGAIAYYAITHKPKRRRRR